MKSGLTIFTPTYNRAYILPKLYNDLLDQSNKNFTWLLIDDGSIDETESLAQEWIKDNKITINYFKQPNGGKYTAINKSLELCLTSYYTIIDSDDSVTKDFVQVFFDNIRQSDENEQLLGICTPKHCSNSKHSCETYPKDNEIIFYHELKEKFNYLGETTVIMKTGIIKNFRFPVFKEEKFMSEVILLNQFFYDYKFLSINKHISSSTYLVDGITLNENRLMFQNPYATLCIYKSFAHHWNALDYHVKYHAWASAFRLDKKRIEYWPLKGFRNFVGFILAPMTRHIYRRRYKLYKSQL